MTGSPVTAVMEVGGSHVTVGLVDPAAGEVLTATRRDLRSDGSSEQIISALLECAAGLVSSRWVVALPGPFDYARGIGLFRGVGKFDALYGVDLRAALRAGLPGVVEQIDFVNDAHAFALGEAVAGAAIGHQRIVGITLGTGIGSGFVVGRTVVTEGDEVPPEGRVDLLRVNGRPLEEVVSTRALVEAFAAACPSADHVDVRGIAQLARGEHAAAGAVLTHAFVALGEALSPRLKRFGASVLVVGGSMTGSWDLIQPPLLAGLRRGCPGPLAVGEPVPARLGANAALVGAAFAASAPAAPAVGRPEY